MNKCFWLMLATMVVVPTAVASVPHVELAIHHRPTAGVPNTVRLTATNFGPGDAYVMSYQTPFALPDGRMTGRWVDVRETSGKEVVYKGRWVLTRSPGPSMYRRIARGEVIEVDIDLSTEYMLPEEGVISARSSISVMDRLRASMPWAKPKASLMKRSRAT